MNSQPKHDPNRMPIPGEAEQAFLDKAESAFGHLGAVESSPVELLQAVQTIIYSQSSELAFFTLLRVCISGPGRRHAPKLAAVITRNRSAEWAYNLLQTLGLLNARDPDLPRDAPGNAPILPAEDVQRLVDVVCQEGEAEWMYHTLRTVFLTSSQRREVLIALGKTGSRGWIKLTTEDVRLYQEELKLL